MPAACSVLTICLNSVTCSPREPPTAKRASGREKPDRVVAPVVRQTARDDRHLVEPLVDRQELHRGHAKIAQVLDGRRVRQPEIGSPQFW